MGRALARFFIKRKSIGFSQNLFKVSKYKIKMGSKNYSPF